MLRIQYLPDSFLPLYEVEYGRSLLWHEVKLVYRATLTRRLDYHNGSLRVMVLHRSISNISNQVHSTNIGSIFIGVHCLSIEPYKFIGVFRELFLF